MQTIEPLWLQFLSPALTVIIIVMGFVYSKVKLEQHMVDTEKVHDKRIGNLERAVNNPEKCKICPEILEIQKKHELISMQVDMLCRTIGENQKDTKELIKKMAETNSKVDTAMVMMSDSLEFLRSNKFATAMDKILSG